MNVMFSGKQKRVSKKQGKRHMRVQMRWGTQVGQRTHGIHIVLRHRGGRRQVGKKKRRNPIQSN